MTEPEAGAAAPPTLLRRILILLAIVYPAGLYVGAQTIANAVLPQMQGDLSAGIDQISWVVTASVVAAAIAIPPSAWFASRFGRKRFLLFCLLGFTAASFLVGTAETLGGVVFWRVMAALFGAPTIALSQAITLDTFPDRSRGPAFAVWSVGILLGWVFAPALGAYLAELESWRLIFFMLGPLGLLAVLTAMAVPDTPRGPERRFDWLGFLTLSLGLGSFLVVLNRGQRLDWYESNEIVAWTVIGAVSLYLFVVHTCTAAKPLLDWRIFRDRNYAVGVLLIFAYAHLSLAPLVLIPVMLEELRGLELLTTGLVLIPRGLAQIAGLMVVGPIVARADARVLIVLGFAGYAAGSWEMANYTIEIGLWDIVWPNILQGLAMAFIWVPAVNWTYATLEPGLRNDGTTVVSLTYNLSSSTGVAVAVTLLTRSAQVSHEELAAHVFASNEILRLPEYARAWDLADAESLAAVGAVVNEQALMIGYVNVFWLMAVFSLAILPLAVLLRRPPGA